jgi:hypothetical protein
MDLETFTACLERMMERVPEPLLEGLNGGVAVSEEVRRRPDDPPGVYILGEYITDPHLGAMIRIYHGSFALLFGGSDRAVWERELWDTLRHELRHHVEGRAGVRDLDIEDALALARMQQEAQGAVRVRYRVRGRLPRRRP